jgi:SAM-dependent methyltransferase
VLVSLQQLRLVELVYGMMTYVPGLSRVIAKGTGGTDVASYCYSVWLRHVVMAYEEGMNTSPKVVAELGPGDSLGIGLAALVFGAEQYYAFDVVEFADISKNLSIFEEIVSLARSRTKIPDNLEYPDVKPYLDAYHFPFDIYSQNRLRACLAEDRLNKIRQSILHPESEQSVIKYIVPWNLETRVEFESVDLIFSQAVLEHVDDLPATYKTMFSWLKKGGHMSHQIDLRCHGTARSWNGHWAFSELLWKIIRGKRPYLLNREPYSKHLTYIEHAGFTVQRAKTVHCDSVLSMSNIDKKFTALSCEDLRTCGAFILATK